MKARIIRPKLMWYGEVLLKNGWKRVTPACHTTWGARRELNKWKKRNCIIQQFEI